MEACLKGTSKIKISFITDDKRETGRSRLTQPQLRPIMTGLLTFRIRRI